MVSLIAKLKAVEDPRTGNAKFHNLEDILFIAIAAGVAGAEGWYEVVDYAKSNLEFISKYATLPHGIPSHDTFNRVFGILKPEIMEAHYQEWVSEYVKAKPGDCISVDGKTICGAGERGEEGFVHMVSACHSESGISLGQVKVEQKSNEITAIPKLLNMFDINECVITADAMACQKAICRQIAESGGYYVLAVKENQSGLLEGCRETEMLCNPSCQHIDEPECDHGRVEQRTYRVYRDLSAIKASWNWAGLSAVVVVTRWRFNKKTQAETLEKSYYITNMPRGKAKRIAQAIRSHWSVENKLHWALDVTFNEDDCFKRSRNAAENFSRLMRIVHFLLKRDRLRPGGDKSLKRKRKEAGWSTEILERILFAPPPAENKA